MTQHDPITDMTARGLAPVSNDAAIPGASA